MHGARPQSQRCFSFGHAVKMVDKNRTFNVYLRWSCTPLRTGRAVFKLVAMGHNKLSFPCWSPNFYKSLSSPWMGLGPNDRDAPDLAILLRGWRKMGLLTSTVHCSGNMGKMFFRLVDMVDKGCLPCRCCGHPRF